MSHSSAFENFVVLFEKLDIPARLRACDRILADRDSDEPPSDEPLVVPPEKA